MTTYVPATAVLALCLIACSLGCLLGCGFCAIKGRRKEKPAALTFPKTLNSKAK